MKRARVEAGLRSGSGGEENERPPAPLPALAPVPSFDEFVGGEEDPSTPPTPQPKKQRLKLDDPVPRDWRAVAERVAKGKEPFPEPKSRYRYSMVCSSNVNRSVCAHKLLVENAVSTNSYGAGRCVRLPGLTPRDQRTFAFGTPYTEIYDALSREDHRAFAANKMLSLMARDAMVKRAPERWQDVPSVEAAKFDVVFCFENRIFDAVVEDMQSREPEEFKAIHLVAMAVPDNPEESEKAAHEVLELLLLFEEQDDLEAGAAGVVERFQTKVGRPMLHQVCHI